MTWPERSVVQMRKDFVLRALGKEAPITELCRQYGISRKTGYKWIARFKQMGIEGLVDESRRPRSSPLETTAEISLEIIRLRQAHPRWGARKIQHVLRRRHAASAPSVSTVSRILERAMLVRKRRHRPSSKRLSVHRPAPCVEAPNDLWTVDFKGWWRTGDGKRCDPLTVRDAFSRYVLDVRIVTDMGGLTVRRVFEKLFARYGVPKAIQSDNGQPFASSLGLAGLTKLSAWWVSLGIELVRSRPGCPQDNGGHERMHADIRLEIQSMAAANAELQQRAIDDWRTEFNHVRPHEALSMKTPAEVYRVSTRKPMVRTGGYPEDCSKRLVDARGWLRYDMMRIYVSTALAGYHVGLGREPDRMTVWFYDLCIGSFVHGEDESVQPVLPAAAPECVSSPVTG